MNMKQRRASKAPTARTVDAKVAATDMIMEQGGRAPNVPWFKKLVEQAKANTDWLKASDNPSDALREMIQDAELVFGVYPDAMGAPAYVIIKGEGKLDQVRHADSPSNFQVNAVACQDAEEAFAMRQLWGDGAVTH